MPTIAVGCNGLDFAIFVLVLIWFVLVLQDALKTYREAQKD